MAAPWSSSVVAQTPYTPLAAEGEQRYRGLIADALSAYEDGRFVAALTLFEQAYALHPNARAMRGVALVLFELGDHTKALHALDEALSHPVDPLPPDLRAQLLEVRARAAAHLEHVVVQLSPRSAVLRIDGHDVKVNRKGELWLPPGTHRVEVSQAGFKVELRTLQAVPGGARTLTIALSPLPHPDAPRFPPSVWGTAVGIGLLGTGASLWPSIVLSRSLVQCEEAESAGGTCINQEGLRRRRAVSFAGLALGVSLTVSASVPLVRGLRRLRDRERKVVSISCSMVPSHAACSGVLRW